MTVSDRTEPMASGQAKAPHLAAMVRLRAPLVAACGLVAQAFEMAYVAPYRAAGTEVPEADAQGRDPNW